jgi:hypothetical protein
MREHTDRKREKVAPVRFPTACPLVLLVKIHWRKCRVWNWRRWRSKKFEYAGEERSWEFTWHVWTELWIFIEKVALWRHVDNLEHSGTRNTQCIEEFLCELSICCRIRESQRTVSECCVNIVQQFGSYLTVNTVRFHYNHQRLNHVQENNRRFCENHKGKHKYAEYASYRVFGRYSWQYIELPLYLREN